MKPSDFKPMHNGERFQVRQISVMGGRTEWQVYADCLQHIASCTMPEIADMVAKCLNEAAEGVFGYKVTGERIKPSQADGEDECYCHERDGSYVCHACYDKGLRGHMQR